MHPIQRTKLRVCNTCCKNAVIHKYTEQFKLDIEVEKQRKEEYINKVHKTIQEVENISKNIKEIEDNMEEGQLREIQLIEEEKKIFYLETTLEIKQEQQMKLYQQDKNIKNDLNLTSKNVNELEKELFTLKNLKEQCRLEIITLKNSFGDKQDEKIVLRKNIENVLAKKLLNEEFRVSREKEEKLKSQLSETKALIDQISKEKDEIINLISSMIEKNSDLSAKIQNLKGLPNQEKLVSGGNHETSIEEEEKFNELKQQKKEKQIIIENLKIELRKKEPKYSDPNDYELTTSDKTRPCARCRIF